MALNAGNSGATSGLAKAIYDAITAELGASSSASGETKRRKFSYAIASAVVTHITANAVVNVTSVSGVTAGGGTSGPGTGSIT